MAAVSQKPLSRDLDRLSEIKRELNPIAATIERLMQERMELNQSTALILNVELTAESSRVLERLKARATAIRAELESLSVQKTTLIAEMAALTGDPGPT